MENKVELQFDNLTTRLAGFPYGVKVYDEQVKEKIHFNSYITITFPNQIEKVASSFVQGFFSDIVAHIGYKGIEEKVIIKSRSKELTESIRKNIY